MPDGENFGRGSQLEAGPNSTSVAYRETISDSTTQRGRYAKETGVRHYGDVVLRVEPAGRGSGITFAEAVDTTHVPRVYIPAVESGVREALRRGPLGFPVTDVAVTLIEGSHHLADSSAHAFHMAGALAIRNALPLCRPIVLEPVHRVEIRVPRELTIGVTREVSNRRGRLLDVAPCGQRPGWDVLRCDVPEAEMGELVVDVRSVTAGLGTIVAQSWRWAALTDDIDGGSVDGGTTAI